MTSQEGGGEMIAASSSSSSGNAGLGLVALIVIIGVYMLPTIVGAVRKQPRRNNNCVVTPVSS